MTPQQAIEWADKIDARLGPIPGAGPVGEDEPEIICPLTGTYCSGDFCDEYGCAKKAGIWDEEDL